MFANLGVILMKLKDIDRATRILIEAAKAKLKAAAKFARAQSACWYLTNCVAILAGAGTACLHVYVRDMRDVAIMEREFGEAMTAALAHAVIQPEGIGARR
jgi:hypothetical protein